MNKTEALARLNALESEASALRKIIEEPKHAPSLLTAPVPESGVLYWALVRSHYGDLECCILRACSEDTKNYTHGNTFQTAELARGYAEAINTMLLLRHQPGTVAPADDYWQYMIGLDGTAVKPHVEYWSQFKDKAARLSPCFATGRQAEAAIEAIGEARILRMFKTFHHITD